MNNPFQDWAANKSNFKGRFILINYRIAKAVRYNKLFLIFFFWYLILYKIVVEWFMCVELPWGVTAGFGLKIYHGHALVVHPHVIIGNNCILRQSTTIGNRQDKAGGYFESCPVIGNNVDIGSNVCIIGNITIGDNVRIGSGSIVIKNVPSNVIIVGNPSRVVRSVDNEDFIC